MKINKLIAFCILVFLTACNQKKSKGSNKQKKDKINVEASSKSQMKNKEFFKPKDVKPTFSDKKQKNKKVIFVPPVVVLEQEVDPGLFWEENVGVQEDVSYSSDEVIEEKSADEEVLTFVEVYPEYNGGQPALMKYIHENIVYPVDAKENGIQGKVYVQFVVYKDGHLSDFKIMRGVYPSMDREAIRAVSKMPNWIPGKNNGKEVNVRMVIPVKFLLQ